MPIALAPLMPRIGDWARPRQPAAAGDNSRPTVVTQHSKELSPPTHYPPLPSISTVTWDGSSKSG